jgi:ABC-2 type transport system ATP-binding protein
MLASNSLYVDAAHDLLDVGLLDGQVNKRRLGGERTLVVDLEEEAPPLTVDGATVVKVEGPRQWLRFSKDQTTAARLVAAVAAQAPLVDLAVEEPDIEEVVRRIYIEGI